MNILIVDDHAIIHQGLKRVLESEFPGVTFGGAGDSASALELLGKQKWDVVVLDIGLPGRGGLDLLKTIHLDSPKLPVIVFSMYSEREYALRAFKGGASGYLTKESAPDELVLAIHKAIAGGRYVSADMAEQLAVSLGRKHSDAEHEILSDREYQVLRKIAKGITPKEIALELSLSDKTVATYKARILEKLQLKNTAELTRYAVHHGLDA
jgi:DNA-binding NarL/FixJ family response regulator